MIVVGIFLGAGSIVDENNATVMSLAFIGAFALFYLSYLFVPVTVSKRVLGEPIVGRDLSDWLLIYLRLLVAGIAKLILYAAIVLCYVVLAAWPQYYYASLDATWWQRAILYVVSLLLAMVVIASVVGLSYLFPLIPMLIVENTGIKVAIKRSIHLVRPRLPQILVMNIAITVLVVLAMWYSGIFELIHPGFGKYGSFIIISLVITWLPIAQTMAYFGIHEKDKATILT